MDVLMTKEQQYNTERWPDNDQWKGFGSDFDCGLQGGPRCRAPWMTEAEEVSVSGTLLRFCAFAQGETSSPSEVTNWVNLLSVLSPLSCVKHPCMFDTPHATCHSMCF